MSRIWNRYVQWFNALSLRERALVAAAVLLGLVFLGYLLLIDPLLVQKERLSQKIAQDAKQIAVLQASTQELARSREQGPDVRLRRRIETIRQQIAVIDSRLAGMERGLVPPDKMAGLLEAWLARNPRIQLLALRTLPATPLTGGKKPEGDAEKEAGEGLYKHGVEIAVAGSYLDLLQYLEQLEKLPQRMFWGELTIDAHKYPEVTMTLTVYTLSLGKTWLVV